MNGTVVKWKRNRGKRSWASGQGLASYRGHLSHGHTDRLRKNMMERFVLKRGEDDDEE